MSLTIGGVGLLNLEGNGWEGSWLTLAGEGRSWSQPDPLRRDRLGRRKTPPLTPLPMIKPQLLPVQLAKVLAPKLSCVHRHLLLPEPRE